jgi:hypothetical protein
VKNTITQNKKRALVYFLFGSFESQVNSYDQTKRVQTFSRKATKI